MAKDISAPVPSPAEAHYTPRIFVDLTKSDIGELKGVEVGDTVRVVITGKVTSLSLHEGKTGSISLESKDVAIKDAPTGEFEKLAEDDE